jgi:hypothetical protein
MLRRSPVTVRRRILLSAVAVLLSLAAGPKGPAAAGPIVRTAHVPEDGAVVVDVRPQDACLGGSLRAARCLGAASLLGDRAEGPAVSFHALRWVLGTIGLDGSETVVLFGSTDDAWAVGGLLYLAGQNRIAIFDGPETALETPGTPRALSRERVYVAPMREAALRFGPAPRPWRAQLIALAKTGAPVTVAPLLPGTDEER